MPKTITGVWTMWLGIISVVAFAFYLLSSQGIQSSASDNLLLPMVALVGFGSDVMALIFGLFSITKMGDKSVIVYIVTVLGFLSLIFMLGKLLISH